MIQFQEGSHFFRLTAARNRRIQVVPQPRSGGRGVTQGSLAHPCPPAVLGAKLTRAWTMVADIFSGSRGFQSSAGIADRFCLDGIPENQANVFRLALRISFQMLHHLLHAHGV